MRPAFFLVILVAMLAQAPRLRGQQTQPATRPAEITFLGVTDTPLTMVFIVNLTGGALETFDVLQTELYLAIEQMNAGQQSCITSDKPRGRYPRLRLIHADAKGKAALRDRIDTWTVGGLPDPEGAFAWTFDLLKPAPKERQVIYYIADHPADRALLELLAKQKTGVRIHTFLWGGGPADETVLKEIAADHGGEFREVDPNAVVRQQDERIRRAGRTQSDQPQ